MKKYLNTYIKVYLFIYLYNVTCVFFFILSDGLIDRYYYKLYNKKLLCIFIDSQCAINNK